MRTFSRLALLSLLVAGALSTAPDCYASGPMAVDALGRNVSLPTPAARIVSLVPADTEILFAVGAGSAVVADTEFCDYPAGAAALPKIGGFSGKTISIESIIAYRPDLVVASADMHQRVIPLLEAAGVTCLALEPRTLAEVYDTVRILARFAGMDARGEAVAARMEARIEAVRRRVAAEEPATVFWELWDDPLMTSGGGTFVSEAITAAGGTNVFGGLRSNWPVVSLEELIARDPDWILSGDDGRSRLDPATLASRPGWGVLSAVRSGRVAVVPADEISRAGPRLADAVEAIAAILHPDD